MNQLILPLSRSRQFGTELCFDYELHLYCTKPLYSRKRDTSKAQSLPVDRERVNPCTGTEAPWEMFAPFPQEL